MSKSNRITLPDVIVRVDPSTLRAPEGPIHKDDPTHVFRIADSLNQFDFIDPVIVGPDGMIIDGVQRVKAAIQAGYTSIPAIVLLDATQNQVKGIRLALNKLQTGGKWDDLNLGIDIQELIGQGFDVRKLGFETAEIDALIAPATTPGLDGLPDSSPDEPAITRSGDLFAIGDHRVHNARRGQLIRH